MIAVVSKSASDFTVIALITIISLVVINAATQTSLAKRHNTLPFISRQAKIRCKYVGIKMVDKYKLAEYIRTRLNCASKWSQVRRRRIGFGHSLPENGQNK
jgi:hypothetical protein